MRNECSWIILMEIYVQPLHGSETYNIMNYLTKSSHSRRKSSSTQDLCRDVLIKLMMSPLFWMTVQQLYNVYHQLLNNLFQKMVRTKQVAGVHNRPYYHGGSNFPLRKATKSVSTTSFLFKSTSQTNFKPSNKASFIIANAKRAQVIRASEAREHDVHIIEDSDYNSALMEMKKPRFLTYSLPKRTFQVLCKEASHKHLKECRFTREALEALQTAVEDFMVGFFEDAGLAMKHARRKTLQLKDIELISRLRKMEYEPL